MCYVILCWSLYATSYLDEDCALGHTLLKSVCYVIPCWNLCPTSYLDEVCSLLLDVIICPLVWSSDVCCTAPSPIHHIYPPPGHSSSHLQLQSRISSSQIVSHYVPSLRTALSNIHRRTDLNGGNSRLTLAVIRQIWTSHIRDLASISLIGQAVT